MFETSPLMYGVLIVGGLFSIVIGFVIGMSRAWRAREKRDGLR